MGRKRSRDVPPSDLRYAAAALSAAGCARLAMTGRGLYAAVREAVAERIAHGLAEGCIQEDLSGQKLHDPTPGRGGLVYGYAYMCLAPWTKGCSLGEEV